MNGHFTDPNRAFRDSWDDDSPSDQETFNPNPSEQPIPQPNINQGLTATSNQMYFYPPSQQRPSGNSPLRQQHNLRHVNSHFHLQQQQILQQQQFFARAQPPRQHFSQQPMAMLNLRDQGNLPRNINPLTNDPRHMPMQRNPGAQNPVGQYSNNPSFVDAHHRNSQYPQSVLQTQPRRGIQPQTFQHRAAPRPPQPFQQPPPPRQMKLQPRQAQLGQQQRTGFFNPPRESPMPQIKIARRPNRPPVPSHMQPVILHPPPRTQPGAMPPVTSYPQFAEPPAVQPKEPTPPPPEKPESPQPQLKILRRKKDDDTKPDSSARGKKKREKKLTYQERVERYEALKSELIAKEERKRREQDQQQHQQNRKEQNSIPAVSVNKTLDSKQARQRDNKRKQKGRSDPHADLNPHAKEFVPRF